jgi:hypothetical protein
VILYSPLSSVTVARVFSIKAGLDASTVTPGSTAPEESLTVPATIPVLVPCARDTVGSSRLAHTRMMQKMTRFIERPP